MKNGLEAGEFDVGPHRSRRLLGVVILLLFITGCIGLQVLLYLASSGAENRLWRVGILANSTADYSLDENIQVAPISPDILDELARDDARLSPTPTKDVTPPVIGQIVPTQTTGPGNITTPAPVFTIQPTTAPTASESPTTPTSGTPLPTTRTPTTPSPTGSPTTPVPTTPIPTTTIPTTPVPTTKIPTSTVVTPTVTPTPIPTTRVPTTPVPTTRVPTTPVATTTIPPTPIPTTQVPTIQPTTAPTELTAIPTPWVPPTDEPTMTEETLPGSGLDAASTPTPPRRIPPTRLDLSYQILGLTPQSCQIGETLYLWFDFPLGIAIRSGTLTSDKD